MKTKGKKSINKLTWACAWCGRDKYSVLKKGQNYTHGICFFHKLQLIAEYQLGKPGEVVAARV